MKFNIITLMPGLIQEGLNYGVVGSSFKKGLCELNIINPRDFTEDVHQTVDDRPFGGGDGMLMMGEPLQKSLESLDLESREDVYFLSPQGPTFNDEMASSLSQKKEITLLCGRYGGVDHRFLVSQGIKEISIGDYVLSGGELGALVIVDSVARKIPGVLGHSQSAHEDSFSGEGLLEAPYFTRPREYQGMQVPEALLSGDHKKIEKYRRMTSLLVTLKKRPELLESLDVDWKEVLGFYEGLSENDKRACGVLEPEMAVELERRAQR